MKTMPIGIRLPVDYIAELKRRAVIATSREKRLVHYLDLVRDAIFAAYPMNPMTGATAGPTTNIANKGAK